MSDYVLAAIDGSHYAESVCDYAVWAATALSAPLPPVSISKVQIPIRVLSIGIPNVLFRIANNLHSRA